MIKQDNTDYATLISRDSGASESIRPSRELALKWAISIQFEETIKLRPFSKRETDAIGLTEHKTGSPGTNGEESDKTKQDHRKYAEQARVTRVSPSLDQI